MSEAKWYLRTQDETFGPETEERLVEWARLGRIQPGQEVSDDNDIWRRVEDVPFLDMRFSIDIGDGNPRGPFNRAAAEALLASGRLPPISSLVEVRGPFEEENSPAEPVAESSAPTPVPQETVREVRVEVPVEKVVEKIVEKEVRVEVPVERIVEREVIKEIPVEKIVEKEVVREVPVERLVEREKIVVDEARVKELEEMLSEERRHTGELQARLDENSKKASEASLAAASREAGLNAAVQALESKVEQLQVELRKTVERADSLAGSLKETADRETKGVERIQKLEDDLRRLPQAASEVAEIQAAMFGLMSDETADIAQEIETAKKEFEEIKRRYDARAERLASRRCELLKRSGEDVGAMTHKALLERPEDPRTTQLRKELDDLRHLHDRSTVDYETRIRQLNEKIRIDRADFTRRIEGSKDLTQLQAEAQQLREQLQRAEQELMAERQRNESMRQQQAANQQALMTRLAALESPSIGTTSTLATNQSREAKQVKLPGWMRLGK